MKKITALMAVAALGLAACGSSSDNSTSTAASSGGGGGGYSKATSTSTATNAATSNSSGEVKLGMANYKFQPAVITGKAGSTVKVELKNDSGTEHNFSIESQKINKDVEAGEDATVSVKIPASGTVQFFCEYHKGLGMTGVVKAS